MSSSKSIWYSTSTYRWHNHPSKRRLRGATNSLRTSSPTNAPPTATDRVSESADEGGSGYEGQSTVIGYWLDEYNEEAKIRYILHHLERDEKHFEGVSDY